ncbi:MAG: tetratricopeptide repeat protein [Moraxella sp.]|nr:tetratricopeptide repeat protein [Moraxella sp.]
MMKYFTRLVVCFGLLALALTTTAPAIANDVSDFNTTYQLANQGNAEVQNKLGNAYYNGQGVRQDYTKAFEWFTKAAHQGYANSQRNLGLMYDNGWGVYQDHAKAVE